ncbi:hypothetical protein BDW42DRAFT_112857 [Aspergillus taichungensis]|uniref:Uncharacterized protein n=1 Tax=Aspergillus taichungensis TaxID=482145 RepID=A0A2J5HTI4_9EURO|nr:hypothetical protein BDW42DRAFT_112857 [Aspergillus taichungensis]
MACNREVTGRSQALTPSRILQAQSTPSPSRASELTADGCLRLDSGIHLTRVSLVVPLTLISSSLPLSSFFVLFWIFNFIWVLMAVIHIIISGYTTDHIPFCTMTGGVICNS